MNCNIGILCYIEKTMVCAQRGNERTQVDRSSKKKDRGRIGEQKEFRCRPKSIVKGRDCTISQVGQTASWEGKWYN